MLLSVQVNLCCSVQSVTEKNCCSEFVKITGVSQIGQVEGKPVEIVLDTGCARTMVWKKLVRPNKITERQVSIHCAHGSSVTYPLAQVKIAIGHSS